MDPNQANQTGAATSAYLWTLPGQAVSVYLDFDVVDRLGFDIMRGFGAVPKRGAEVGGILLGTAETGENRVVRIEDFVPVASEHLRGPSYVLSEADLRNFDAELGKWAPAPDKRIYAVGYYRSNTRDVLQLTPEDLQILEKRFPQPAALCLLVKPYATRVSEATFFLKQNGAWPEQSGEQVFPFRRKELGGGKPPRRPRGMEAADAESEAAATGFAPETPVVAAAAPEPVVAETPVAEEALGLGQPAESTRQKYKSGWVWIPLSFIFLLLGVVLGFQIALSYRGQKQATEAGDPYALELTAVQFGENLHLKWNAEARAFQTARRGMLYIQDGDNAKTVTLTQEDLARGGVLYRNATGEVRFRMEVFARERNSVSESLELHVLDAPAKRPQAAAAEPEAGGSFAANEENAPPKEKRRRRATAR